MYGSTIDLNTYADLALEKRDLEKIIAGSRARIKEIDNELDELMKQSVELAREGKLWEK